MSRARSRPSCLMPLSTKATPTPATGAVGRVGYEINFNRYFYKYVPPRPLEEIDAELRALEAEIAGFLKGC